MSRYVETPIEFTPMPPDWYELIGFDSETNELWRKPIVGTFKVVDWGTFGPVSPSNSGGWPTFEYAVMDEGLGIPARAIGWSDEVWRIVPAGTTPPDDEIAAAIADRKPSAPDE